MEDKVKIDTETNSPKAEPLMIKEENEETQKAGDENGGYTKMNEKELEKKIDELYEKRTEYLNKECKRIKKKMDFGACKIDDLDALTLSLYLNERTPDIEVCHLGANKLTDEGLVNILSGLQWHTNLRELYLGNNGFTSLGVSEIIHTLPFFKNIKILSLGNCGFTDDTCIELSYEMMELTNLESLYLNYNKIGDGGLTCLSILLKSNLTKLKTIHLGENKFTPKGLICFLQALYSNKFLNQVSLNDHYLSSECIVALNKTLISNNSLTELNLGNCGIDDEGIMALKSMLSINTSLNVLHLWGNNITDDGALILESILEKTNHSLTLLTLSDNDIKDQSIIDQILVYTTQNQKYHNLLSESLANHKNPNEKCTYDQNLEENDLTNSKCEKLNGFVEHKSDIINQCAEAR